MSISPNMNLVIPVVGTTLGPQWATDLDSSLTIIDGHDHSSGSGVQVTTAGLNINADLSIMSNNLYNILSCRFDPQVSPLSGGTDLGCVYVSGVDLYYNDVNGNQIQITEAGGVAGTPGSIANLVSPASATYVAINETFVWQSNVNTAASLDARNILLRNSTANSKALTLKPPTAMAANFSLTLPSLPASQKFMTLDNTGAMAAPWAVDGASLEINSNTLQIKDLGVTTGKINDLAVTTIKIADLNVTTAKIADANVTTVKIADANVTRAKLEAVGQQTDIADYETSSATFSSTGALVTRVTTGRPIILMITTNDTNTGYMYTKNQTGGTAYVGGFIRIVRDGATVIYQTEISDNLVNFVSNVAKKPLGLSTMDIIGAGGHQWDLQIASSTEATVTFGLAQVKLIAYEL